MLTDRVESLLHAKVLLFDSHVVAFVELVEHLSSFDWLVGHIFVNLGDVTIENQLDIFQLSQEKLHKPDVLLLLKVRLLSHSNVGLGSRVREKQSFPLWDKLVERVTRFDETNFSRESKVGNVFRQNNLSVRPSEVKHRGRAEEVRR